MHVSREHCTPHSAPQAGVAPASHYCHSLHPGRFLCVCTSLSCVSLIPVAFKELVSPHSPASQLPLLSCYMREITRRPVCQQLLCKSYLQREEGMRREMGGEGVGVVVAIEIEKCNWQLRSSAEQRRRRGGWRGWEELLIDGQLHNMCLEEGRWGERSPPKSADPARGQGWLQNAVTRPTAREASNTGSAETHQCHGYQPDALHASCGASHKPSGVGEVEPYVGQGTLGFQLKTWCVTKGDIIVHSAFTPFPWDLFLHYIKKKPFWAYLTNFVSLLLFLLITICVRQPVMQAAMCRLGKGHVPRGIWRV